MARRAAPFVLLLAVAACGGASGDDLKHSGPPPVPVGCVNDVSAGHHVFDCDGLTHDVNVPAACVEATCGLIVDVHGGTMNGQMEDNNTNMRALGAAHGYIVLQPNAVNNVWNAATDDTKVLAFIEQVASAWHVDGRRTHMMGFSQGGYMTWRFVCRHTDLFASVAPAAAAGAPVISIESGCTFTGSDVPSEPIDILYMHGTQDALVSFSNALVLRDAIVQGLALGPEAIVQSDAAHRWTRRTESHGKVFEFIQHDYMSDSTVGLPPLGVAIKGHCYPGSKDYAPSVPGQLMGFGCNGENAFHWGEVALQFFMAHPRR